MNLKVPQILLHDIGHRHAQRGRKILRRHALVPFRILQQVLQAVGQTLSISRREEFNGQLFRLRHLAEVPEIRADDRHSVSAGEMSHATASR